MLSIRNNSQRARLSMILLLVTIVSSLVAIYVNTLQLNLIQKIKNGYQASMTEIEFNDQIQTAVTVLGVLIFIVTATAFIMWFRRAYFNLEQKTEYLDHNNQGAVWGWFIPFVNLVKPVKMMNELYYETHRLLSKHTAGYNGGGNRVWITIWWIFWLGGNIAGNISLRRSLNAKDLDSLNSALNTNTFAESIQIVAALLAVKVVWDYSRHEALLDAVPAPGSGEAFVQPAGRDQDLLDG